MEWLHIWIAVVASMEQIIEPGHHLALDVRLVRPAEHGVVLLVKGT